MAKTKERSTSNEQEVQSLLIHGVVHGVGLKELSKSVRFHRKKSGLSQIELSRLAGVGKTTVFDLEKGKQTIQLDTLQKVLQVLNINVLFQSPIMEIFLRQSKSK